MKKKVGAPLKYGCKPERFAKEIPSDITPLFDKILTERALKKRILTKEELKNLFAQ